MSKQFEQLKILYEQILNISNNVKISIDNEDYNETVLQEEYKAQLVSRVVLAKKTINLSTEEITIIEDLKKQILSIDKENIDRMQLLRDKTLTELKNLNSQNKIANKYENIETVEGSICDYTSD